MNGSGFADFTVLSLSHPSHAFDHQPKGKLRTFTGPLHTQVPVGGEPFVFGKWQVLLQC